MELLAFEIAKQYNIVSKGGDGSYLTHCPVHGGDCLHVSPRGQLLFYCNGTQDPRCTQDQIRECFKRDGFDLDVYCVELDQPSNKKTGKKPLLQQNLIAHDQTPYDWRNNEVTHTKDGKIFTRHRITACYTYTNEEGKIVFYQLRADTNEINKKGKKVKLLKVYSSFVNTQTGENTWSYSLELPNRPLYNLHEIVNNPNKPVIIFEGEKTCEAGKKLFPDHVCTTWSLGMIAWKGTDFKPLKGREVFLWPDNSEQSIAAFTEAAQIIEPTPKIIMTTPLLDRPADWDIADDLPNGALDHWTLLSRAEEVERKGIVSPEDESEIVQKYNSHLRVLHIGASMEVYDKSIVTPNDTWLPYARLTFPDLPKKYVEKSITQKGKIVYAVDIWKDSPEKIITYGINYDPSTHEELIKNKYGNYETNKFLGWDHEPEECDLKRYDCFLSHIFHVMDEISAKYFINFIAHLVQNPKQKPGVIPILIGKPAHGKTIIGDILQAMLGDRNFLVTDGATFNSKWSGQFSGKIACFVNEFTTRGLNLDFINTLLTDKRITLEHKNKPLSSEISYHRIIGASNDAAFSLSADDRRMFPIHIHNPSIINSANNKQIPENRLYYKELDNLYIDDVGLSGLHFFFKNYKQDMEIMAPPITEFRQIRLVQRHPVHAIIQEICENGCLPSAFGKTVKSHIEATPGDGRTAAYPFRVYRQDMMDLVKELYPKDTQSIKALTSEFMKFIAPKDKSGFMCQSFIRDGSQITETARAMRYFEFPPLSELRALYNTIVDAHQLWTHIGAIAPDPALGQPPHLRLVKDEDDGSPI